MEELQSLLNVLELEDNLYDWLILLLAKTGLRISEGLGLTPNDFDFVKRTLTVNKTWDYKSAVGKYDLTKNKGSMRTIAIDETLNKQFQKLIKNKPDNKPIFVNGRIHVDTINNRLTALCKKANIEPISLHGLRHTHASLLIYSGVSIASVAKRLGHTNTITTQRVYLHLIKEMEDNDNDKIMQAISKCSI